MPQKSDELWHKDQACTVNYNHPGFCSQVTTILPGEYTVTCKLTSSKQQHAEGTVEVLRKTNAGDKRIQWSWCFRSDRDNCHKFKVDKESEIQVSASAHSWCSGMTRHCPPTSFNVRIGCLQEEPAFAPAVTPAVPVAAAAVKIAAFS